jgi:hypothetical protein
MILGEYRQMTSHKIKISCLLLTLAICGLISCKKTNSPAALLAASGGAASGSFMPSPDKVNTLLTVDDVERITGVKGLQRNHGHPGRNLGNEGERILLRHVVLQFDTADGDDLLRLSFYPASEYEEGKSSVKSVGMHANEVKGVGDEAFVTMGCLMRVKTGSRSFGLNMAIAQRGQRMSDIHDHTPELKQLALVVLSRL